jgi:hypothetical protein
MVRIMIQRVPIAEGRKEGRKEERKTKDKRYGEEILPQRMRNPANLGLLSHTLSLNNERTKEKKNETTNERTKQTTEQAFQAGAFSYINAHRRRREHPHHQTKSEPAMFLSHDNHPEINL